MKNHSKATFIRLTESNEVIKTLKQGISTSILVRNILDCIADAKRYGAEYQWKHIAMHAWNGEKSFYGQIRKLSKTDIRR